MSDDYDEHQTALSVDLDDGAGLRLQAAVVSNGSFQTIPLPAVGEVRIGRYAKSDICIDDPSISRFHATLHLGPPMTIEDLGSSNGTQVGGVAAKPARRVPVKVGEPIRLGAVTLIIQRRLITLIPR